jgi:RNA-binding protein
MKSSTSGTANTPPVLPEEGRPLELTPSERSALRARAHGLNPVVMIGQAGLTDAVLLEIHRALQAHELVKVRLLGGDRADREGILAAICHRLSAAPVQHIGKILVVYRPA